MTQFTREELARKLTAYNAHGEDCPVADIPKTDPEYTPEACTCPMP